LAAFLDRRITRQRYPPRTLNRGISMNISYVHHENIEFVS